MPTSLFGTDGVRGRAGSSPLDERTLVRLGAAVARICGRQAAQPRVLIGRDTRESGVWVARHLARGVEAEAAQVADGGVLSTPAVAFLARDGGFDAGLVVSASHNPFQDNGVKVFTGEGMKADDDLEACLTAIVADHSYTWADVPLATAKRVSLDNSYVEHTRRILDGVVVPADLRIAIDCANGATSRIAPTVLRGLGFDPIVICDEPDGRNINLGCGSTHPGRLAQEVLDQGCRMGAAFDGDGDRVVLVDHNGQLVNGDAVLLIAARRLAAIGTLREKAIVATVMSNIGLEHALRADGIKVHWCGVGDRLVWAEMSRRRIVLWGEQSGHIIFADHLPTGDGLATALLIIRAIIETGCDLADLAAGLRPVPQVMVNVRVRRCVPLAELPEVSRLIDAAEHTLADTGRILVRYSGTESLLRIMVEGPDRAEIGGLAKTIADRVRAEVGVGA